MAYSKVNWTEAVPITPANLDTMETGIAAAAVAGTAGGEARTNTQNDGRFIRQAGSLTTVTTPLQLESSSTSVPNIDLRYPLLFGEAAGMVFRTAGGSGPNAIEFRTGSSEDIVGRIRPTNTGTQYVTSSDHRLKDNVQAMSDALDRVGLLNPCTFDWKATGEHGEGFIAHELAEVVPSAVAGDKDAVDDGGDPVHQGVDFGRVVPLLVAAVQELTAKVASLEAELAGS